MGIEFTKRLLNLRYSTENLIVVQIQLVGNLINWKLAIFNNRLTCENFPTISNLLKQWTSNLLKYQWIQHLRLKFEQINEIDSTVNGKNYTWHARILDR